MPRPGNGTQPAGACRNGHDTSVPARTPGAGAAEGGVQLLRTVTYLQDVSPLSIAAVANRARWRSVPPRQVIFREGDPCRDLHVLVEGRVECYRSSVEGREQIMIVFDRPGDTFCISSAFATGRNLVTARALTLTRLGVIDRGTFVDVAGRNPAMALQLVKTVSRDAARIMDLAESLALRTARARVARLLYEQAVAEGVRSGQGVELARERLREEEVAARVGTVRVHVSRSLRSLVRSGTIVLDRALIRIPDLAGLARAAQGHADRIGRERPLARAFSRPARPVTFVTDTGPTRA